MQVACLCATTCQQHKLYRFCLTFCCLVWLFVLLNAILLLGRLCQLSSFVVSYVGLCVLCCEFDILQIGMSQLSSRISHLDFLLNLIFVSLWRIAADEVAEESGHKELRAKNHHCQRYVEVWTGSNQCMGSAIVQVD